MNHDAVLDSIRDWYNGLLISETHMNYVTYDSISYLKSKLELQLITEGTKMSMTKQQAMALAEEAARALEEINKFEQLFGIDDYANGTILYADVKFRGASTVDWKKSARTYNYAFIKANGYWYSSGPRAGGVQFSWESLTNWLNSVYIIRMGITVKNRPFIKKHENVM